MARARDLSPAELWLLARAALMLPLVSASLRLAGVGRTRRLLSRLHPRRRVALPPDARRSARAAGRIVAAAARRGPFRARCLAESLVLWSLLRRRGLAPHLCVGVARRGAALVAHAWVELEGEPLNDGPDVRRRYAAFSHDLGRDFVAGRP